VVKVARKVTAVTAKDWEDPLIPALFRSALDGFSSILKTGILLS
jgi:hypothetical protein